ncbi:MAG TPA: neutral/alkaline non-lysosomal ceramidase N-terminal domain-containing protein [Limnochordia bacterium]
MSRTAPAEAGFAEVVVTPPLGTGMAGYFRERSADGVRDDLYSRALVVSQGDTCWALVVTDLIGVPMEDVLAVRRQVARRTGIPEEHVLVAATHTHTGPVTVARPGFERDETYMRHWARLTAGAVELAFRRRVEATVGVGRGRLSGVAFHRRFKMRNGWVHTNPGVGNPDIVEPAGPVDEDVTVVRFDGPDGRPIGILTHFACHPDTVGGTAFSGDWIGAAARALRPLIRCAAAAPEAGDLAGGGRPGVVVLNGACGDINHVDVRPSRRARRWPATTELIGVGLAAEAGRVALGLAPEPVDSLGAASRRIILRRIPIDEFLAQNRAAIADPRVGQMERRRAEANLEMAGFFAHEPETVEAEITCLRIGRAIIASCPGELSCELGLAIKEAVPGAFVMVANLSNGYLGYIPAARTYREGGYEGRSSRLQPGSGEEIVAAATALARALAADAGWGA